MQDDDTAPVKVSMSTSEFDEVCEKVRKDALEQAKFRLKRSFESVFSELGILGGGDMTMKPPQARGGPGGASQEVTRSPGNPHQDSPVIITGIIGPSEGAPGGRVGGGAKEHQERPRSGLLPPEDYPSP